MASLLTNGRFQALDAAGIPIPNGTLASFVSGTTTPQATFTDSTLTTPNTNPVTLNARGEAQVWIPPSLAYSFTLKDASGVTIWTVDGIKDSSNVASDALRAELAAPTTGPGLVGYQQDAPAVAPRTLLLRLKDRWHIKDFKVTGDGSTWHQAMNRAALSLETVDFDPVSYDVGSEVVLISGSHLRGRGMYSGAASPDSTSGISVINYVGSGGLNTAVIRASAAAVGVDPPDPNTRSLQNVTFTGFQIAAGSAEKGFYGVRCLDGGNFDRLSVTGSTQSAFWLAKCAGGAVRQWKAYKVGGSGYVLGRDDYAWGSAFVDETHFDTLVADYFGCNADGSTKNVFSSGGAGDVNVGFSNYCGRGVVFTNPRAHYGDGPAWFMQPLGEGVQINGGYMEACGRSTGTTRPFGFWYNGDASHPNTHVHVRGMRVGNPSFAGTVWTDTTPLHRLRGTAPTRRESGPIFEDMFYIGEINSSWNSFGLVNSQRDVVLSAAQSAWFDRQRSGARSLGLASLFSWTTSAGAISGIRSEGMITSIVRASAGTFTVTLSESTGGLGYRVAPGAMPHLWTMNIARVSNTVFTITTENAGVPTDPGFICDAFVWPDYA